MKLSDMIVGHNYLVGDGCGYDAVICKGVPTQEELIDFFGGNIPEGITAMKIEYEEGKSDIFFETSSWQGLYIEPR